MKKPNFNLFALIAISFTLSLASCKDDDPTTSTATPSLYERLGKTEAITAVVDKFLGYVVADTVIVDKFEATLADTTGQRVAALRQNLIDQICAASGGPCTYTGKNMMEAHAGMGITDAEFNALVGDLVAALDFYNVPQQEKTELLGILGPLQPQIVGQ